MTACISSEILRRFLNDELGSAEESAVVAHLEQCPKCQDRADCLSGRETTGWEHQAAGVREAALADPPSWKQHAQQWHSLSKREASNQGEGSQQEDASGLVIPDGVSVLGDYRLVREIARGGMGVVYEAEQVSLRRRVALKILPMAGALEPRQLQWFHNEARSAAALDHANIVKVYSIGCEQGIHYYAMEYVGGRTLASLIDERRRDAEKNAELAAADGKSAEDEAISTAGDRQYCREIARLGIQAAEALEHAHQTGVTHRDIKPSNLLIDEKGHLWVADFGLAKVEADAQWTRTGDILGTIPYMSPEQAQGERGLVDQRTDVYSLGITLYELLTLQPAFPRGDPIHVLQRILREEPRRPRQLNPGIPHDLETIVLKAIAKEPQARYQTARELAEDLRSFLDDRPIAARRAGVLERAVKWSRRHSGLVAAAAAVLAVATIALSLSVVQISRANLAVRKALDAAELSSREAIEQGHLARQQAGLSRQLLYASNMRLAAQAWANRDPAQLAELLQWHVPRPGQSDLRGFEWHFLAETGEVPCTVIAQEDGPVYFVCYSPDGSRIATAGKSGVVRVYDAKSLRELRAISGGQGEVNGLAFDPAGRELASAGDDGTIRIWGLDDGKIRLSIQAFAKLAYQVAFTPDGAMLASCGDDPVIRLWDPTTGEAAGELDDHIRRVEAIAISPTGELLASASADSHVQVWNINERQTVRPPVGANGRFTSVAFSGDGQFVAAGAVDGRLMVFRARSEELLSRQDHQDGVLSVAFSPWHRSVVVGDRGGVVKLSPASPVHSDSTIPVRTRDYPAWQAHAGEVNALAVSPDGKQIVSAGGDGKVVLWTASHSTMFEVDLAVDRPVLSIAFDPASGSLFVNSVHGILRFDPSTGERKKILPPPVDESWTCIDVSPNGVLAAGSDKGRVLLWDLPRETAPVEWDLREAGLIHRLCFFADGSCLAAVGWDERNRIELFDVAAKKNLPPMIVDGDVDCLARPADGRTLLASANNHLLVVDPETRHVLKRLAGHTHSLSAIAVSPAERLVATVGNDRRLILWDLAAGKRLFSSLTGSDDLISAGFSADGCTLAIGGRNGAVQLWHVPTRQVLLELPFGESVEELAFSPDGTRIALRLVDRRVFLSGVRVPMRPLQQVAFSTASCTTSEGTHTVAIRNGEVWHAIDKAPFVAVNPVMNYAPDGTSTLQAIAVGTAAGEPSGDVHVVAVDAKGRVFHTLRRAQDGQWIGWADVTEEIALFQRAVGVACSAYGETLCVDISLEGGRTIRTERLPDRWTH